MNWQAWTLLGLLVLMFLGAIRFGFTQARAMEESMRSSWDEHQAFYGGQPTEDDRLEKIEGALRVLDNQGITDEEFVVVVKQILKQKRRRRST